MNPLKVLKRECKLIDNVLDELSLLETFEGADYSDVVTDLKWNRVMLENRVKTLQTRRRNP